MINAFYETIYIVVKFQIRLYILACMYEVFIQCKSCKKTFVHVCTNMIYSLYKLNILGFMYTLHVLQFTCCMYRL